MRESSVLKLWEHPKYYMGETWEGYYVVIGQHRDSPKLDRSNFRVAHKMLRDVLDAHPEWDWSNDTPYLINPYEGHWAVGHVEWLGVHKDAPQELIECAETIVNKMADYPILDEFDYSDLEWTEANEYWDHASIRERVNYWIKPAGLPCFAARHDLSTIMHTYNADRLWEHITQD